ncbi:unnamed protein product [Scytosiphon promiscuus]
MSSKLAKRMMSRVDEMVSRASSATKRTDLSTSKRKAAKRALLQPPSKRKSSSNSTAATKSSRTNVSKKGARNKSGRRQMGLLDQARRELRGKSRVAQNVSLMSYKSGGGGGDVGLGSDGGAARASVGLASKSRKAVEHLLQLDSRKARGK